MQQCAVSTGRLSPPSPKLQAAACDLRPACAGPAGETHRGVDGRRVVAAWAGVGERRELRGRADRRGGWMTPVGTKANLKLTDLCSGFAVAKLAAVAVATIETQLSGSPRQVPKVPLTGLGGAVHGRRHAVAVGRRPTAQRACRSPAPTPSTNMSSADGKHARRPAVRADRRHPDRRLRAAVLTDAVRDGVDVAASRRETGRSWLSGGGLGALDRAAGRGDKGERNRRPANVCKEHGPR